ncbi:hypothetical protein FBEOM_1084 [Fusarium beomiforme]|uniref:Uncharacterized protein n=1 Tax=Fusarium beomiforme TaxID=44412 RepID=A0A9P5AUI6_9HYPO|nr:hypothetical protein FBEOM_1084 [Fusarium beomiforme]
MASMIPPEKEESQAHVQRDYDDEFYSPYNWFNNPDKANERIVVFAASSGLLFVIVLILVWRIRKSKKAAAAAATPPDDDEEE